MLQVLFDSEQQKIVYAEAQGDFVDGLCKLLLAPHHELVRFPGPDLDTCRDDGNPANRASRLPFSTLQERCVLPTILPINSAVCFHRTAQPPHIEDEDIQVDVVQRQALESC
jgi:hypothetical protein